MTNHTAERAEHQITKGDSHHGAHTTSLQQEAQSLLGGLANNVKHAAQEVQHLDFSDPFKAAADVVVHAAGAVGKAADAGFNAMDSDKNGHYIKHEILGDNKVMAGVGVVAVGGCAVIAGMVLAPEALAAAGVTGAAALVPSMAGVFAAGGLKMDYDRRHPNQ